MTDGKFFFDLARKKDIKTYEKNQKLRLVKETITRLSLFKKKKIKVDQKRLSKQQPIDTDTKVIKQINSKVNLERVRNKKNCFLFLKKQKKPISISNKTYFCSNSKYIIKYDW